MEYGYVITLADGSTVSDGGFASWEEAREEVSCVWEDLEENWDSCPVDFEICEN